MKHWVLKHNRQRVAYFQAEDVDAAERHVFRNFREQYFGGFISQVDENNQDIPGGDFAGIPIESYFKEAGIDPAIELGLA